MILHYRMKNCAIKRLGQITDIPIVFDRTLTKYSIKLAQLLNLLQHTVIKVMQSSPLNPGDGKCQGVPLHVKLKLRFLKMHHCFKRQAETFFKTKIKDHENI